MNNLIRVLAGCGAFLAAQSCLAATVYTDRAAFEAAITGEETEGFTAPRNEYIQYGPSYGGSRFDIEDSTKDLFSVDPGVDPRYYQFNTGAVLDTQLGILTITAGVGIDAIGFAFANPPAFDSPSHTITIDGRTFSDYQQPRFGFFGIVTPGERPTIVVDYNGGLGILDNLSTGVSLPAVPLPPSAPMFGAALVLFGAVGRHGRQRPPSCTGDRR